MLRMLLATFFVLPCLALGKMNDQLELLMDVHADDSIVSITQKGAGKIFVVVQNHARTETRTLLGEATPEILEKLKAKAAAESVPWTVQAGLADSTPVSGNQTGAIATIGARAADDKARQSNLRKNKLKYVSTQTIFSTYTYGIALPIALEAPEQAAGLGLLALPVSFGAHYFIAWDRDYQDSHLLATGYFATNSLFLSYGLPFLVLGPDLNAFRVGTFAVLGAYPLSLHYGYKHGTRFQDEPGRVSLQSSFTYSMGFMGYAGILLWAPSISSADAGLRLGIAQVLGMGIAGHYLSYQYRTEEKVPGGIGPGISTFSILGAAVAGSMLASIQPDAAILPGALMVAGIGGGFLAGQAFFRDKYDNVERAGYNDLGAAAGAVTPLGLMMLAGGVPDSPGVVLWSMTAGAFGGYFLTRHFTSSLVETPRSANTGNGFFKNIAFNPMPIPVPEKVNGKYSMKWAAQLVSANF